MDTKKLRQKILDLAIHGKLVPQNPNDEPASVLLERIRAEKERLIAEGKIKRSKKSATSDTSHYENVPFEVPEGWSWTSLNSVCTIFGRIGFRGYTKDDLVDSTGAITLSPSNIVDGVMNFEKCTYISWEKYEESPEIQVQNEDVLLVKTGSSYGKCAYVESLPKEATINPQFVVLKFIGCNPRFLTCCLQSNYARKQYEEFVLGTAIPTFTQVALGAMAIPMPPIEEQERIVAEVEKLLTIVDNIEQSKQDLSTAITQTKNRILDLAIHGKLVPQDPNDEPAIEILKRINPKFVPCNNAHYENVPNSWCWTTLGEVCELITGSTPSKLHPEYYGGDFPFYKPTDLDVGRHVAIPSEFLTGEGKKVSRVIPVGATAICCIGSIGKCGYIEKEGATNQQINTAVPSKSLHPLYLYYFCNSTFFVEELTADSSAITISIVNKSKLSKMLIPIPPYKEQQRIVTKIEKLLVVLDNISAEL